MTTKQLRYISLFSGIGGFEVAIHKKWPDAICLGYSEVKPSAIRVYQKHFPNHNNLGDITKITEKMIDTITKNGCDLIVAGFPCTNLSRMAGLKGKMNGLKGEKSGLFYNLLFILKIIFKTHPNCNFIIENNSSMTKQNQTKITNELQKICNVYTTHIDNASISVQTRKRIFWTTYSIEQPSKCLHTWNDILEPISDIDKKYFVSDTFINGMNTVVKRKYTYPYLIIIKSIGECQTFIKIKNTERIGNTRYQLSMHSDTGNITPYPYPHGKSRPICAGGGGGFSQGMLIDRRFDYLNNNQFKFRYFTMIEKERLFGFSDKYTESEPNSIRSDLLGNSISVYVILHILDYMRVN